jgi:hypothetical protein
MNLENYILEWKYQFGGWYLVQPNGKNILSIWQRSNHKCVIYRLSYRLYNNISHKNKLFNSIEEGKKFAETMALDAGLKFIPEHLKILL